MHILMCYHRKAMKILQYKYSCGTTTWRPKNLLLYFLYVFLKINNLIQ